MIRNSICEYICAFIGCKKYLKEPITLPCGDTVCQEHLNEQATFMKCPVCQQEFKIPEEGLKINQEINILINKNSHLNGQHRQVKDLFDKLEEMIEDFHSNLDRPQLYIDKFFSLIRNKIDLHRERIIESVHKRSEQFLNKLKEMEQECYKNEPKSAKIDLREERKDEMIYLKEKLREKNLKESEMFDAEDTLNKTIEEIKTKRKCLENSLLMNKTISFVEEDSKQLGHLIVNQRFDQFEITEESGKLIKTLDRHQTRVKCIQQIEDFSKIVTGSDDRTIKICSTESGEFLKTLTGHTDTVSKIILSNDNKCIISSSWDKTVKFWNIENDFEYVQTMQQEKAVSSLCLLPNNILVCGLSDGKIIKWNLSNFAKLDSFKAHESDVLDLKHVSSSQIASCSRDTKIKLWNLETNECLKTFIGHTKSVNCLEISFDKIKLYSGSSDLSLRVWRISSGVCLKTINLEWYVYSIKLLSSNFLAVGLGESRENIKIFDLKSHEIVKSIETRSESLWCLTCNPESNILFSGSGCGQIEMWQF
jgi:WD40 repeat protein